MLNPTFDVLIAIITILFIALLIMVLTTVWSYGYVYGQKRMKSFTKGTPLGNRKK